MFMMSSRHRRVDGHEGLAVSWLCLVLRSCAYANMLKGTARRRRRNEGRRRENIGAGRERIEGRNLGKFFPRVTGFLEQFLRDLATPSLLS